MGEPFAVIAGFVLVLAVSAALGYAPSLLRSIRSNAPKG